MMRRKGVVLSAALLLVLGAGCSEFRMAGRVELPAEQTAMIAEHAALYREVAAAQPFIETVDGYADVWIKTPKRQKRLFCNIRVNRGHEARLIVTAGILGWPVADMFFKRDSLYVHDMLNNNLFLGSNNDRNIEKIIGVNSGYRVLTEALLGVVGIPEPESAIKSVKKGSGQLLFTVESARGTKELVVDPIQHTLTALLLKNREGRTVSEIHFRNFERVAVTGRTALVPKEIEMLLYNGDVEGVAGHQLVIAYDERTFNKGSLSSRFSIPKKARVFNLDDPETLPWM
ncbi:MAG: DUF4292 domain-containing protein [Chlorobiaceae bacterium]